MTYLTKPKLHHPSLDKNALGLTRRDYEGAISTLCAGCGHDSISAAIIQSCFELDLPPHRIAKRPASAAHPKRPRIPRQLTASTASTGACRPC
jgi:2-oxoglutarate ferredoxin oxidoreductase subunit beta